MRCFAFYHKAYFLLFEVLPVFDIITFMIVHELLFMAGVQNKELKLLIPRKWALCLFHSDTYNYFYFLPLPWCHTINSPWTKSIWYLIVFYLWLTNSQRNIRNKIKGFAPCLLYCSDTHEHHYQQLLRVVTKLNHVRCGKDWTKSHFTTWKSLQKT